MNKREVNEGFPLVKSRHVVGEWKGKGKHRGFECSCIFECLIWCPFFECGRILLKPICKHQANDRSPKVLFLQLSPTRWEPLDFLSTAPNILCKVQCHLVHTSFRRRQLGKQPFRWHPAAHIYPWNRHQQIDKWAEKPGSFNPALFPGRR